MKIKLTLLILLYTSFSAKAEELLTFDLDYCIDSSSYIFRAKIINEKGLLEINQVFHGKIKEKNIVLPYLVGLKNYEDYIPSNDLTNWEIMVFLKKMNPSSQTFIPAFDISNSAYDLALSIFWIKNNKIYYSWQPSNPGRVYFKEQGYLGRYEKLIKEQVEVKIKIEKIEKKKRCKRKKKLFSRLFNQKKYQSKIYDAVLKMDCEQEILKFIETHLSDNFYGWVNRRMIQDYVTLGKEKKTAPIEAIFETEFSFWKNYIQKHPNKKWWKKKNGKMDRLYYFFSLTRAILTEELGDWEGNTKRVYDLFSSHEKYQNSQRDMTINKQIDRIRLGKIKDKN